MAWSPCGRWFVATVHGGMGFEHAIIAIKVDKWAYTTSSFRDAGRT